MFFCCNPTRVCLLLENQLSAFINRRASESDYEAYLLHVVASLDIPVIQDATQIFFIQTTGLVASNPPRNGETLFAEVAMTREKFLEKIRGDFELRVGDQNQKARLVEKDASKKWHDLEVDLANEPRVFLTNTSVIIE